MTIAPASEVLVGRGDELEAIGAFLDAPSRRPRALLIEGEVGIGKTTLLAAAAAEARARGCCDATSASPRSVGTGASP